MMMQTFGEQLTEARKALGMTQEQIAQAVHVSRQTISRWETGKNLPDVETIKMLSVLLQCNFFAGAPLENRKQTEVSFSSEAEDAADRPDDQAAVAPEAPPAVAGKNKMPVWAMAIIALLCVVVLLLVAIGLIGFGEKPEEKGNALSYLIPFVAPEASPIPAAFFQQEQIPEEGKAFVSFKQSKEPHEAVAADIFVDGYGWFFTFVFSETNGVPFTVNHIVHSIFRDDGSSDEVHYQGDGCKALAIDRVLYEHIRQEVSGGFPLQGIAGVGLSLSGEDANGNALEFHSYIELSKEISDEPAARLPES